MKGYGPVDALEPPGVAGVSTFLRLPHSTHLEAVDVAVVGLPFEGEQGSCGGVRLGPKAIREASLAIRPFYNPGQRVRVFDRLSAIDYGDAPIVPGFTDRSYERMAEALTAVHAAGATPLCFGGARDVLLPELRAAAKAHGPLALVLFGPRADVADAELSERPAPGTVVRQAVEEGLVDPARSTLLGARGGMDEADELERGRQMGFVVIGWDELAQLGTGVVAAAVDRAAGMAYLSFDIGFVDPAFAPGTAAPVCGGPTSTQALALLRACRGLQLAGADVVEVLPELDQSRLTATLAATVAWEMLALMAAVRPEAGR